MSEPAELIELHRCVSLIELAMVRAAFDHRGIPFAVEEEDGGEYSVWVRPESIERAREALADRGFDEEEPDETGPAVPDEPDFVERVTELPAAAFIRPAGERRKEGWVAAAAQWLRRRAGRRSGGTEGGGQR